MLHIHQRLFGAALDCEYVLAGLYAVDVYMEGAAKLSGRRLLEAA
jgi:hypothetical protein